jgi:hypothetical protein
MRADRQRVLDTYGVEQWAEVGELRIAELTPPQPGPRDHPFGLN